MGYSQQECAFILERYFASKSFIAVREAFHHVYPDKNGPNKITVQRLAKKCRETGSVCVKKHAVLTNDAVRVVHETLLRSPMKSLRRLLVAARRSNTPHYKQQISCWNFAASALLGVASGPHDPPTSRPDFFSVGVSERQSVPQ
jgi:hypothetical protein